MPRRKLLFLISEDWFFALHFLPLAKAIAARGYEVSVATQVNAHADAITSAGVALYPIRLGRAGLNPISALAELADIKRLYARLRPDVVHQIALKPIVLGTRAAASASIPGVVNMIAGLGYVFADDTPRARLIRSGIAPLLKRAFAQPGSRIMVQHRDDAAELGRLGLAARDAIDVVPGVGILRHEFDIPPPPPGPPLVVLPARLLRHKGVLVFAEAARRLKHEGLDARFAIAGAPDPGNPASLTEDDLSRIAADGAVELWGWRDDMRAVLAQSSIVCLPTYYREGLPKSLLEAAAANRAIVTTDMPGSRDVVLNGDGGWLARPRDAASLAAALREAITNPAMRTRKAQAACDHARAHYGLDAIAQQTIDIYEAAIAHRPRLTHSGERLNPPLGKESGT